MESKKYTTFVESYFSDEQNGKEKTRNETFFIPIPKELIKKLKWTEDTDIGISVKDNTLILTKMWRLHLDAADHAGLSIDNNLYSTRELYHLAIAKYYESRIDELDHNASMQVAVEQHETFKQYSRVLVDEEEGIKI